MFSENKDKRYARIILLLIMVIGCATTNTQQKVTTRRTQNHLDRVENAEKELTKTLMEMDKPILEKELSKATKIGKSFIGKTTDELIEAHPNVRIMEYDENKYRYTLRYEVTTVSEIITEQNIIDMDIHLFSGHGIITKFQIEPVTF